MFMKKFLSIICVVVLCLFLSACKSEKQMKLTKKPKNLMEKVLREDRLVIGVKFDARPFGFLDKNGELKGFDIDLAKKITKNILGDENKVEFVQVTPSNRILTLTSGKVDMVIATMSITPQRAHVVDFSTPYFVAGQALMTPRNSSISGLTDLKDKKIIVVLGSTGEKSIKYFAPNAIVQGFKTNTEAYNALKSGLGDAMTTDDTILAGFLAQDSSMKILPKRYTQEPYAIAFRQDEDSRSLKDNVNHVLEHLRMSGELTRLKNKWINF